MISVVEEDAGTTLVADVHTHTAEGKVLEEGVGYVELIVAACPLANGGAFLAAGPVLSYYEFKHPMNDRLIIVVGSGLGCIAEWDHPASE